MEHKLAIIGFGGMAGWHYENIKNRIPQITVKGAVDVRPEALEKAESKGLYAYKDLQELLDDTDVDIVTIATPNNYHKDLAISALCNGKNVICEKPVTLNARELEEIIKVSEETGKLFTVHQNRRWDRDFQIVKKVLNDGTIGTPYFIESRVEGSRQSMHGWRGHKINGGGMLLDWGVHMIDQLLFMIPEKVVSVYANLITIFSDEVDDNDKITLKFANGLSATIELSTNCFVNLPRWRIMCTDGTVVVRNWECEGEIVKLNTDAKMEWEDDIVYTAAGPTRTMAPRPKHTMQEIDFPEVPTDWADFYKNVVDALDNGASLIVKPEQCLRVMKVIDNAFISHETGASVQCNI